MTLANVRRTAKTVRRAFAWAVVAPLSCFIWGCPVPDEPAQPSVEIDPAEALAGTTVTVLVRGSNTHFDRGDFSATLTGSGARIRDARIAGPTAARLVVEIDDDAQAGPRTLRVAAAGERFDRQFHVRVLSGPVGVSLSPSVGTPDASLAVAIEGRGTHFEDGATMLLVPESSDITVQSVRVSGPEAAVAVLHVAAASTGGRVAVAVVTRDEVAYDVFEVVTEAGPSVTAEPSEGYAGQHIDVSFVGSGTDFDETDPVRVSVLPAGSGVTVEPGSIEVQSKTVLSLRLNIAVDATLGFQLVRVSYVRDHDSEVARGPFFVRGPPGAPGVSAMPNSVRRGQSSLVWLKGRSTSFGPDVEIAGTDDAGVLIAAAFRIGPEDLALEVEVEADAAVGPTQLIVHDGDEVLAAPIEVLDQASSRIGIDPPTAERGRSTTLVARGVGTHFVQGLTMADLEPHSGVLVSSVEIADEQTATVVLDVQDSAPEGAVLLALRTAEEAVLATLFVAPPVGTAPVVLTPPVVRAAMGAVEVVAARQNDDLPDGPVAVSLSDPAIVLHGVRRDAELGTISVSLDVTRAARPGSAVLTIGEGPERRAARLAVLPAPAPVISTAPGEVTAGESGRLLVLVGQGTSFLRGVTLAAPPPGRGLFVNGITVVDGETAILELSVLSDAPAGPTGLVLATHGEIAAAPLTILPLTPVPSITVEPPWVEPGDVGTIELTVDSSSAVLTEGQSRLSLPAGSGITVESIRVLGDQALEADIRIAEDAPTGTRVFRVLDGALSVPASLTVRGEADPSMRLEPMQVRRGASTAIEIETERLDLSEGEPMASVDTAGVTLSPLRAAGEGSGTLDVTVDPNIGSDIGAVWLTVDAAGRSARHMLLLSAGLRQASAPGASLEAGTRGSMLSVQGSLVHFSPGETLVLSGAGSSSLRFGTPEIAGPTQLRVAVDASAHTPARDDSQILFVTGPELVAGTAQVRRGQDFLFAADTQVDASLLGGLAALLTRSDDELGFLAMRIERGAEVPRLAMQVLAADGLAALTSSDPNAEALIYPVPRDGVVRVDLAEDEALPLAAEFTFLAEPLVPDAVSELEPNESFDGAEPVDDFFSSPAVLSGRIDPSGEFDLLAISPSGPACVEVWARRLSGPAATPDIELTVLDQSGQVVTHAAPKLGADLFVGIDPDADGEPSLVRIGGLAGSAGPYLAVLRPAVVVDEIGWTGDGGYVELRAVPGGPLGGYTLEVQRANGESVMGELDLSGLEVPNSGLVVVSGDPEHMPDLFVMGLEIAAAGRAVLRLEGRQIDAVAFGATRRQGEGDPAETDGAESIARRLGIDRNDNRLDFEPGPASPGW